MDESKKYGMWKGKWVSDLTREELLELVLHLGEENYRLQKKEHFHERRTPKNT